MLDELIQRARSCAFTRASVRTFAAELPADDAILDRALQQAVALRNARAFRTLVCAALGTGRAVSARHLVEGAALFDDVEQFGRAAWRFRGPVADAVVAAVRSGRMGSEREAMSLLLAALWAESRGVPIPEDLPAMARRMAPGAGMAMSIVLSALAGRLNDALLLAIVGRHPGAPRLIEEFQAWRTADAWECVPVEPAERVISGFTYRKAAPQVGRNEPCPCGSGKKYKQCCWTKDQERGFEDGPGTEAVLNAQRIYAMRSHELAELDPARIPDRMVGIVLDRLLIFHEWEAALRVLDSRPMTADLASQAARLADEAVTSGDAELVRAFIDRWSRHAGARSQPGLAARLLADGSADHPILALLESEARRALSGSGPDAAGFAWDLLSSTAPALGNLVTRGVLPAVHPLEASTLLEEVDRTRAEKLGLEPDDTALRLLELVHGHEADFGFDDLAEDSRRAEDLRAARAAVERKSREIRDLQRELDRQRASIAELERRAAPAASVAWAASTASGTPAAPAASTASGTPAAPTASTASGTPAASDASATPAAPTASAASDATAASDTPAASDATAASTKAPASVPGESRVAPAEPDAQERIQALKQRLRNDHAAQAELRKDLQRALAEIDRLRVQHREAVAPPGPAEDAEERLLEPAGTDAQGTHGVRVPVFARSFEASLRGVPVHVARAALRTVGELAAGSETAFRGARRIRGNATLWRQRIGISHRLLFRLDEDAIEIVQVVSREALGRVLADLS